MPLPKVHRTVQDQQGNIVPAVLGSVFNQGTGVLAPLWRLKAPSALGGIETPVCPTFPLRCA